MKPSDFGALFVLSALWGGSFLFIRVAAPVLGPITLVAVRVLIAGIALLLYAAAIKKMPDLRERWRQYLMVGLLNSVMPFVLISAAELHLTASFAAILNATSPIFGALIAAAWIKEPLTLRKIIGLALGVTGVAVLVGWSPEPLTSVVLRSVGLSLLGAAFYGLASVYIKVHLKGASPLAIATGGQLGASLLLWPLVPFALPTGQMTATVAICVLLLSLFSTALAFLIYFRLIVNVGPTKALTVTFLSPVFGVTWGALLLNEAITRSTLLGCAIILFGTALVTGVRLRPARVAQVPAADTR